MIDNILKVLLLVTPLIFTNSMSLINLEWMWFRIAIFILFIGSLLDIKKREFIGKRCIIILLSLGLFSIYNYSFQAHVVNAVLNIFLFTIGLKIIVEYCEDYESIYKYIILGIILNCVAYVCQINGYDPIYHDELKTHPGGFLNSTPRLTTYIAIMSPLAIYYSMYLYIFLMGFCFLNDPQVWAIGSCILILFIKSNSKIRTLMVLTILNMILWIFFLRNEGFIFTDIYNRIFQKILVRLEVIRASVWYIFYYNFKGCGFGLLPETFGEITAKKDATILSSLLQFIMQGGILTIPFMYFLIEKFKKLFDKTNVLSLSVLSIIFMTILEYPFEIPRMPFLIMSLIGFFVIHNYKKLTEVNY